MVLYGKDIVVLFLGVTRLRIEKDFRNNHRLREWLDTKSWEHETEEEFYEWLEKFFEEGNRVSVKGAACDLQDCIDLFESDNDK